MLIAKGTTPTENMLLPDIERGSFVNIVPWQGLGVISYHLELASLSQNFNAMK
jgi:hypothetical protein